MASAVIIFVEGLLLKQVDLLPALQKIGIIHGTTYTRESGLNSLVKNFPSNKRDTIAMIDLQ